MQPRAAIQGAIQYRAPRQAVYGGRSGRKTRAASRPSDAFAFLNQRIEGLRLSQSPIGRVRTEGLCARLAAGCRRLFEITGDGFPIGDVTMENVEQVLEGMNEWSDAHDLNFMVKKNDDDDFMFFLYKPVYELNETCFQFFCAPAESLPKDVSELYKRFIKYLAKSLGINVCPKDTDNGYLNMLLETEDEEEATIVTLYKSGKIKALFDEIDEKLTNGLAGDLIAYRKVCDPKHLDLVELMIEGTKILPFMNRANFDFNPLEDGFSGSESYIEFDSMLAILYSEHDGMSDTLLNSINSDWRCGLCAQGWNRWLILSPDISPDEWQSLADTDTARRFLDWSGRFYEESVKFDNYKKEEKK